MPANIQLRDDTPDFAVQRREDGHLELQLTADCTTVTVVGGRFADDATTLAAALHQLAEQTTALAAQWPDIPDEEDGYLFFDSGRYHVQLAGQPVGDFASQDIAEYELARAMHADGYFPAAWIEGERGGCDNIDTAIGAHFDHGVAHLKPLPGIVFQPGDRVRYTSDEPFTHVVIGDWGLYGIEIHVQAEPRIRALVTDRALLRPADDA